MEFENIVLKWRTSKNGLKSRHTCKTKVYMPTFSAACVTEHHCNLEENVYYVQRKIQHLLECQSPGSTTTLTHCSCWPPHITGYSIGMEISWRNQWELSGDLGDLHTWRCWDFPADFTWSFLKLIAEFGSIGSRKGEYGLLLELGPNFNLV